MALHWLATSEKELESLESRLVRIENGGQGSPFPLRDVDRVNRKDGEQ